MNSNANFDKIEEEYQKLASAMMNTMQRIREECERAIRLPSNSSNQPSTSRQEPMAVTQQRQPEEPMALAPQWQPRPDDPEHDDWDSDYDEEAAHAREELFSEREIEDTLVKGLAGAPKRHPPVRRVAYQIQAIHRAHAIDYQGFAEITKYDNIKVKPDTMYGNTADEVLKLVRQDGTRKLRRLIQAMGQPL